MQKLGLQVTSYTRKSRRYNSYKGKVGRIAPNRIHRRFHTTIPHQKITTDTTEFKYYEIDEKGRMIIKKLYLDPFLDMFNGEILSYGISKNPSAISGLSAQKKAIEITADCPYRRTFHSDRGWAYQMPAYSRELQENKIFQSMSRKGNCYDNSVMENFFGLLWPRVPNRNLRPRSLPLPTMLPKRVLLPRQKNPSSTSTCLSLVRPSKKLL